MVVLRHLQLNLCSDDSRSASRSNKSIGGETTLSASKRPQARRQSACKPFREQAVHVRQVTLELKNKSSQKVAAGDSVNEATQKKRKARINLDLKSEFSSLSSSCSAKAKIVTKARSSSNGREQPDNFRTCQSKITLPVREGFNYGKTVRGWQKSAMTWLEIDEYLLLTQSKFRRYRANIFTLHSAALRL